MFDLSRPLAATGGLIGTAVLAIGLQLSAVASAAEEKAEDEATAFLLAFFEDFNAYLANDSLTGEEGLSEYRRLLNQGFHLDTVSQYVLGEHWHKADDGQKTAFRAAFEDYIIVTYGKYVPDMKPMGAKVFAAVKKKQDLVQVRSNVFQISDIGENYVVDYALKRKDGDWGIVNIRVQGYLPIAIHRSDFTSFADSNGVDALLEELREKNRMLSPDIIKTAN